MNLLEECSQCEEQYERRLDVDGNALGQCEECEIENTQLETEEAIKLFEKHGFKGTDVCLETSLVEYHLLWREEVTTDETVKSDKGTPIPDYLFVFAVRPAEAIGPMGEPGGGLYDYMTMTHAEFIDMIESDWFDLPAVLSFAGIGEMEFRNSMPWAVHTALMYYGFENVFGSVYESYTLEKMAACIDKYHGKEETELPSNSAGLK